jgi:DNA-binding transcriptional MerR regulator
MFSIGELSKHTGVKVPTIRYYEQVGLISAAYRSEGNQRRYSSDELDRLSFIRHSRDLGFSIEAIKELIDLNSGPDKSCEEAHRITSQHLAFISERIKRLRKLEKELKRIEAMSDAGHVHDCRVIHALADHSLCQTDHKK